MRGISQPFAGAPGVDQMGNVSGEAIARSQQGLPQGRPQNIPGMRPPQQIEALKGIGEEKKKFDATNAQYRKGALLETYGAGMGSSAQLGLSGQPGSMAGLGPSAYGEYTAAREAYQIKQNDKTRELARMQAIQARMAQSDRLDLTKFNKIIANLSNMQDLESAHFGMVQGVADRLQRYTGRLELQARGGAATATGVSNYGARYAALKAANPNMSEFELAKAAHRMAGDTQSLAGPNAGLSFIGDKFQDFDDALGGYGTAALIGAGTALALALAIPTGGTSILATGSILSSLGLGSAIAAGGATAGVGVMAGADALDGTMDAQTDAAELDEYTKTQLEGMQIDQGSFESAVLLQVAEGLNSVMDSNSNADRTVFSAMQRLINAQGNGESSDGIIQDLMAMKEEHGLTMNEIHASLVSTQNFLKSSIAKGADAVSTKGAELGSLSPGESRAEDAALQLGVMQQGLDANSLFLRKVEDALTDLETFDYDTFTSQKGNEGLASNRLVTPKMQAEAAEAIAIGTLEGFIEEDGSVSPEFTDLITQLAPEEAAALMSLVEGRGERMVAGQALEEDMSFLSDAIGENNPDQLALERELAGIREENTRENIEAAEDAAFFNTLIGEISGGY